jgi:hypothetical protein
MEAMTRATMVLASLAVLGCHTSGSAGEFDDDAGIDEGDPPDLPQPQCDPRRVDDCPSGQKCSYVVDAELGPTNRCVDLLGEKIQGDSCELIGDSDDCAAHRICWATDPDGHGICIDFCDAALTCESDAMICSVASDGLLPLCLPRCDPLAQDCFLGWGCYPDPGQRWVCDVNRSGATGVHGDPCECLNCCDPGLVCVSGSNVDAEGCGGEDGAVGCCAQICELEQELMCPSEAEQCEAFYDPDAVMEGFENLGICQL